MKKIVYLILSLSLLCACESKEKKAERLYNEALIEDSLGNYEKEKSLLEEAIGLGHPMSLYQLGNLYCDTLAGITDSAKAMSYYQEADRWGIQEATSQMGMLYYYGSKEIKADTIKAIQLFKKAGERNTKYGYYAMSEYYFTKKDTIQARKYLELALNLGCPEAYASVAAFYVTIDGNYKKALELLKKGVELKASNSYRMLGYILSSPEEASNFSIEPNGEKAVELLKKAVDEYPYCAVQIGWLYSNGYGIEKDESKALYWFKRAADSNEPVGMYNYAIALYYGNGCNRDKNNRQNHK